MRPGLEALISSLGLRDKIMLLGWRNDIAELLYASDIFVLTSLWEGLPCSIVEAMCCSKPVVANAVDGVKEIVQDGKTGFLTEPRDYASTAEKINYLLSDQKKMYEMGKRAKEAVTEEFDINYTVCEHEKLYSETLGKITLA